jgi:hypothetical protein
MEKYAIYSGTKVHTISYGNRLQNEKTIPSTAGNSSDKTYNAWLTMKRT